MQKKDTTHRLDEAPPTMEQQRQDVDFHVRLPPPTDSTSPLAKLSHQHVSPSAQQNHLPEASNHYSAGNAPFYHHKKQQLLISSLSPRELAAIPGYSPPSYAYSQQFDHDHDPSTLSFPKAPSTELAPLQLNAQDNSFNNLPPLASLASLASLTGPSPASSGQFGRSSTRSDTSYSPPPGLRRWPSGNPYSAYYATGHGQSADSPARMDMDSMSSGTRGPLSPENMGGRASSVSLDDPDVKMAAEALGDLKTSKFVDTLLCVPRVFVFVG